MKNPLITELPPATETTAEALLLHAGALPALFLALLLGYGMMWLILKTLDALVAFHCQHLQAQPRPPIQLRHARNFRPAAVRTQISAI